MEGKDGVESMKDEQIKPFITILKEQRKQIEIQMSMEMFISRGAPF